MTDKKKQLLAVGIVVFIVGSLVASSYIIRNATSFSYSSKASDSSQNEHSDIINRSADKLQELSKNQLPECVQKISYFPSDSKEICQIQFSCTEKTDLAEIKNSDIVCSGENESMWCSDNSVNDSCNTIGKWTGIFEQVCGCE